MDDERPGGDAEPSEPDGSKQTASTHRRAPDKDESRIDVGRAKKRPLWQIAGTAAGKWILGIAAAVITATVTAVLVERYTGSSDSGATDPPALTEASNAPAAAPAPEPAPEPATERPSEAATESAPESAPPVPPEPADPVAEPAPTANEASPALPRPTQTQLSRLRPISAFQVSEGISVAAEVMGECRIDSNYPLSPLAKRCFSDEIEEGFTYIFDPCFGEDFWAELLACASTPWENEATLIHVEEYTYWDGDEEHVYRPDSGQPVPDLGASSSELQRVEIEGLPWAVGEPWAVELANGARCRFVGGATFAIENERANYGCEREGDSDDIWVVGVAAKDSDPWFVQFLNRTTGVISIETVAVAWY